MGNFQLSIDDLNAALAINDKEPQVLYKLGLSFYAYEKFKKCIKTLKKALQCKPYFTYEADIYYHIGLAYCHLEKFEKSIYPYSKVYPNFNFVYSALR